MTLSEYLHFLSYTKTLEELWDAHCRQMARFGFDRLIYGYTQYRTETSLGDPEDFVILTNHEKPLSGRFFARWDVLPRSDVEMGAAQ